MNMYGIEVVPFYREVHIIQGEGDDQKTIRLHPSQAATVAQWIIESAAVVQGAEGKANAEDNLTGAPALNSSAEMDVLGVR